MKGQHLNCTGTKKTLKEPYRTGTGCHQCCGPKYIDFRYGSWILAQFGSRVVNNFERTKIKNYFYRKTIFFKNTVTNYGEFFLHSFLSLISSRPIWIRIPYTGCHPKPISHLSADYAVAAVEVAGIHVHGAALSPDTARLAAGQLGQHPEHRHTHHVGEPVGSVRGDHRVLVPNINNYYYPWRRWTRGLGTSTRW